jgi:hypothetical protein
VPREKAEALLPILVISCLGLNSRSGVVDAHKHILQSVFASSYFFNRAKLVPFPIHAPRMKRSDLTSKAMAFLHGRRLMDILTPCEEAFVRFVILVDIMRYHQESLEPTLDKYHSLFSTEEKESVFEFMDFYKSGKADNTPFPVT